MVYGKGITISQLILIITLTIGNNISKADPGEILKNSGLPTSQYNSMGKSLTVTETMELHQRRFIDTANSVAKLFNNFDQKIHAITLAAKDASYYPFNERVQLQLLNKTRQMEREQRSFNIKYSQLQSQMEYEFRSFVAARNNFMEQQEKIKD